jgi:hypothetical protein
MPFVIRTPLVLAGMSWDILGCYARRGGKEEASVAFKLPIDGTSGWGNKNWTDSLFRLVGGYLTRGIILEFCSAVIAVDIVHRVKSSAYWAFLHNRLLYWSGKLGSDFFWGTVFIEIGITPFPPPIRGW